MAKTKERATYRCTECGADSLRWAGRCAQCHAWGTVVETVLPTTGAARPVVVSQPARPITEVSAGETARRPTGLGELDRVLGDGLVDGATILLTGEPGIGKSTMLLEVAAREARGGQRVLYISGEESVGQIRMRGERMSALHERLLLASETDLGRVLGQVEALDPDLLILDSVQTVTTAQVEGSAGGVAQVRACAAAIVQTAKQRNLPALLVGHVTKDGSVAGPRTLEHLVDVVITFEGERHASLRMLRAVKNRFGAVDEVGCFELVDKGIRELSDPSGLFIVHGQRPEPGTAITVALEGRRPLAVEVQALVTEQGSDRRITSGVDASRVAMIAAVLRARMGIGGPREGGRPGDVYAATLGGVRVAEPAADLALALAVASATTGRALPSGLVAFGEVGLAGDVRAVTGAPRRVREAHRLGFDTIVLPARGEVPKAPPGVRLIQVDGLRQTLDAARVLRPK